MPSSVLSNISPYEKLYETSPTYDHLKSFGCLCFATSPKVGRDKFQSRSLYCVFLGYPCGKKGYKLLSLSTFSIIFSRDVVIYEHIFPYKDSPSTIFPAHVSPFIDSPIPLVPTPPLVSNTSLPTLPSSSFSSLSIPTVGTRKSSRTTPALAYLFYYICCTVYAPKVPTNAIHHMHKPQNYQQTTSHPAWQEEIQKEFDALKANNTWNTVPLPPYKKSIPCK